MVSKTPNIPTINRKGRHRNNETVNKLIRQNIKKVKNKNYGVKIIKYNNNEYKIYITNSHSFFCFVFRALPPADGLPTAWRASHVS